MCIEHYLTVLAALSLLYSMYEDLPRENQLKRHCYSLGKIRQIYARGFYSIYSYSAFGYNANCVPYDRNKADGLTFMVDWR